MLLDPFEEEFNLPTALVEGADGRCRQGELVGEEHQRLAGVGILETDAAQRFGVILSSVVAIQCDGLVAEMPLARSVGAE